jgi:hypothetical protein
VIGGMTSRRIAADEDARDFGAGDLKSKRLEERINQGSRIVYRVVSFIWL